MAGCRLEASNSRQAKADVVIDSARTIPRTIRILDISSKSVAKRVCGIIGGLLSGGAIFGAYLLVTANANGADGGDWLAFAGVFFGVVFTIMGSRALEQMNERAAQKAAIKRLRGALDVWTATVNDFPGAQNMATLADLRQQLEYIGAIGADVGRDVVATNLSLHIFTFHVPAMLEKLRKIVGEFDPGAPQQVAMNLVLTDLRAYAQNV